MAEADLTTVEQRMQPGEITLEGFLGSEARALAAIIETDERTLSALALTHASIAEKLDYLTAAGKDIHEQERIVEGRYRLRVREDRGFLPCPFGDGLFRKGEVAMICIATGRTFYWSPLSLHMIRCHGFYGGRGSKYRLEPAEIAEVAGLSVGRKTNDKIPGEKGK